LNGSSRPGVEGGERRESYPPPRGAQVDGEDAPRRPADKPHGLQHVALAADPLYNKADPIGTGASRPRIRPTRSTHLGPSPRWEAGPAGPTAPGGRATRMKP